MNPYLNRIITSAATWQAVCGVFNAVAVSLNPPIPPVIVASVNGLIVAISAGFVVANVQGYAIEKAATVKADKAIAAERARYAEIAPSLWKESVYVKPDPWKGYPANQLYATEAGVEAGSGGFAPNDANAPTGAKG